LIKSTKKQRDKLLNYHTGVGFVMWKKGQDTTCEVEFYLKDGIPCYLTNGKPVEFDIYENQEW